MPVRLHWSPDSANLVIRIALEMLDLPFEAVRLNRGQGDHKTAAYLAKNPQGLIPVLEDDELVLFETGAILWHLAEKTGQLGPNGPLMSDPTARSTALKWVFFISNTVHSDLRIAFYPDRYVEDTEALRTGISRRVHAHFDLIESNLNDGLIGAAVSVPDIYIAVCARWAQVFPRGASLIGDLSSWPKLFDLCRRIETDPATLRAFTAESIPGDRPLTAPLPPDLPEAEVTGLA